MESAGLSFDDTSVAYSAKSDKALKKANMLFSVVNNPVFSEISTRLVKTALWFNLPVNGIIKKTVFSQFCGGETIEESQETIEELAKFNIGTILDYAVEGAETQESFESTKKEILKTIDRAAGNKDIPFSVFKPSGIASNYILEKVSSGAQLTPDEQQQWKASCDAVDEICSYAHKRDVRVLIDAEDSWMQKAIDDLVYDMMKKYNKEKALVFNTFQMYRKDMLNNLRNAFKKAVMHQHYFGAKLVRGAYMEKERERAEEKGYPDPIHPDKEATDADFNKALNFCIDNKQRISVVCGSHNEFSNRFLAMLMEKHSMNRNDDRAWFAQLYGMGDNISFQLAKEGYNVVKYVPYGPVKAVMPYLFRRAEENTSMQGQSSRELMMIRAEIERRKVNKLEVKN